jgi:hypothetical protein
MTKKKTKRAKPRASARMRGVILDTETTGLKAPKKRRIKPRPALATDELIALICKAAAEEHKDDRLAPGVQIAWVEKELSWYVALHRYPQAAVIVGQRIVVAKVLRPELYSAVHALALQLIPPSDEARRELARALGEA